MKKFIKFNFKVEKVSENQKVAKFVAFPLVHGFGSTLGNTLRRVMLSSILGSSIYAYEIVNVHQEFRNLAGCLENVVQISLNIQNIIVKVDPEIFEEEEKITLHLKTQGAKKVFAKEIETPAGVTIINPEQKILTIVDEKLTVEINFFVIQGRGFSNFVTNKKLTKNKIGYNTVSANFSPVVKVGIEVEEIKIGEQDITEKLSLMIETNGSLSPGEVLARASQILMAHLEFFSSLAEKTMKEFIFHPPMTEEDYEEKIEIRTLDFSERTRNSLEMVGIKYLDELKEKTQSELLEIKNLGQKSLSEIVDKLHNEYKIDLKK